MLISMWRRTSSDIHRRVVSAVRKNKFEEVVRLLESGVSPDACDDDVC